MSPVYLESLKSYESFASSDSLFAKACEKFHLLDGPGAPTLESFKRKVLRVDKLKDERVLEMSVTLPNPAQAQALVQYLAEQAVILSHELGHAGDKEPLEQVQGPLDAATAESGESAGGIGCGDGGGIRAGAGKRGAVAGGFAVAHGGAEDRGESDAGG